MMDFWISGRNDRVSLAGELLACLYSFILIHSFTANCIAPIWRYKGLANSYEMTEGFYRRLRERRVRGVGRGLDGGSGGSGSICTIANVIARDVFVVAKGVCAGSEWGLCLLPYPFLLSLTHTHTDIQLEIGNRIPRVWWRRGWDALQTRNALLHVKW